MFKSIKIDLFAKILFSYILFFLIPLIVFGVFMTRYAMKSYKDEIIGLNVNTTSYIRRIIDENIDVDVIRLLISNNQEIMKFVSNNNMPAEEMAYSSKKVAEEIDKYRVYKSFISAIHLYSSGSECVVTRNSYYTKKEYYDMYMQKSGMSYEEWSEKLFESKGEPLPIISVAEDQQQTYSSSSDTTATIMQQVINDANGNVATILIVLDAKSIINTYMEIVSEHYSPYFAIASDNEVLIESDTIPIDVNVNDILNHDENIVRINDEYIAVTSHLPTSKLNYISILSEYKMLSKIRRIYKILILCILFITLIMIPVALVFSKKTFSPIRTLLKLGFFEREYKFKSISEVQGFLVNIINSNKQLSKIVNRQKEFINANLFKTFIQNSMSMDKDTIDALFVDAPISLDLKYFCAAVIGFAQEHKGLEGIETIDIISNIQDVFNHYNVNFVVFPSENNQTILIFNYREINDVKTALRRVIQIFEKEKFEDIFIAIGRTVDSLNKFTKSYEDIFFKLKPGDKGLLICEEKDISYAERFDFIKKDKIIFDIKSGNKANIEELFETLRLSLFINRMSTYSIQNYVRYLLSDIFKEVASGEDVFDVNILKYRNIYEKAMETQNIEESFKLIEMCFVGIAQQMDESQRSKKEDIIDEIINYVNENYSSADLSLTQIADKLNIKSYKYISDAFKKRTGIKFSDYLSNVRNEEAKRLLLETDLMVLEIAERVGYLGSNAFVKFFKKVNGITPGEFRKSGKV